MSKPLHRVGDIVDVYFHGESGGSVCKVVAVENCHPWEHKVTVTKRGGIDRYILPESRVSSPYNRDLPC
jgi:hypothetical protein